MIDPSTRLDITCVEQLGYGWGFGGKEEKDGDVEEGLASCDVCRCHHAEQGARPISTNIHLKTMIRITKCLESRMICGTFCPFMVEF